MKNGAVYQHIVNGNAANSVVSDITHIPRLNTFAIQAVLTGTPAGTLAVQVSLNYSDVPPLNIASATWTTVTSQLIAVAGDCVFNINGLNAPFVRLVWTPSTGTGTINSWIVLKEAA